MPKDIRWGHIKSPRFRKLKNLLRTWARLNREYSDLQKGKDALNWYNERALLGSFAGAVWRCRGYVIEEFTCNKTRLVRRRRKSARGRADIWFWLHCTEFIGEAKQIWQCISSNARPCTTAVTKGLTSARKDAVNSSHERVDHRLGILFVLPYLRLKGEGETVKERISVFKKHLEAVDYDFAAGVFPASSRTLKAKNGDICPGVVIVGRRTRRN